MSQPYEGDSTINGEPGIKGLNTAGGTAVWGESTNAQGPTWIGVYGRSSSTIGGAGVYGENTVGPGIIGISHGNGIGVFGESQQFEGVRGTSHAAGHGGVVGVNDNTSTDPNNPAGHGVFGVSQGFEGVHGETHSPFAAGVCGLQLNPNGTGAGVYAESRGKGPAGFFKGDVVVTGDVILTNADCAEDFDIAALQDVEPGTVMVIGHDSALRQSDEAYDKRVAGVVSGAGDYKPGIVLDRRQPATNRKSIALLGKVYCRVDAQYSPIDIGDLLTTSPTLGHAMKATDPFQAFGAVVGKALRGLKDGQGLIPILVALQ